jgi:hypothetical protein
MLCDAAGIGVIEDKAADHAAVDGAPCDSCNGRNWFFHQLKNQCAMNGPGSGGFVTTAGGGCPFSNIANDRRFDFAPIVSFSDLFGNYLGTDSAGTEAFIRTSPTGTGYRWIVDNTDSGNLFQAIINVRASNLSNLVARPCDERPLGSVVDIQVSNPDDHCQFFVSVPVIIPAQMAARASS